MKVLLCDLLLLSLFPGVFSSCQRDCLACREKLRPALDSFNLETFSPPEATVTLKGLTVRCELPLLTHPGIPAHYTACGPEQCSVNLCRGSCKVCILECEEKVFPSPLWTPCTKIMARGSWQLSPADPEHVVTALYQPRASEMQHLKRIPRVRSLFQAQEETEPGTEEAGDVEQKQLQKRFGGFTGARKSARKFAHQKRFSEFMRQYLVLSMQSSQRRRTLHQNGNV
ncbi:Prepronociceptin [Tupaia chinensis]|uniref:Prepronociceptin n=1 Tax=Tupaia chinensis TaxID=246437 RepID=L9KIL7_TUPCH|nr:Prepronociceptin [Tupaia chinensis]